MKRSVDVKYKLSGLYSSLREDDKESEVEDDFVTTERSDLVLSMFENMKRDIDTNMYMGIGIGWELRDRPTKNTVTSGLGRRGLTVDNGGTTNRHC